jgi:hypothetical protein
MHGSLSDAAFEAVTMRRCISGTIWRHEGFLVLYNNTIDFLAEQLNSLGSSMTQGPCDFHPYGIEAGGVILVGGRAENITESPKYYLMQDFWLPSAST